LIFGHDTDTSAEQAEAEGVLAVLHAAYPGHPWFVMCRQGLIFIRYLEPKVRGGYGMNVKFRDVAHDSAVLKREVIRKAGEWLERAGLVRGRNNEDEIARVEGVPEKYQPNREPLILTAVYD